MAMEMRRVPHEGGGEEGREGKGRRSGEECWRPYMMAL